MKRVAMTDPDRVSVSPTMDLITTTDELAAACARAAKHPYVKPLMSAIEKDTHEAAPAALPMKQSPTAP